MSSGKANPRAFVANGKIYMVGSTIKMSISDIYAIAPLVEEEEGQIEEIEDEEEDIEEKEEEEIEEEKVKEEEEAKKVHHTRSLFKPARLFKNHHLHFVSEEMRTDAFVNFPPQLQSSSSLLHMGNRHFCYVRTGMPPHPVYGGDHAIQYEEIRFIHIAIFHAPGQT
nr:hypothetical protein CFP56_35155 [Quercus suber]